MPAPAPSGSRRARPARAPGRPPRCGRQRSPAASTPTSGLARPPRARPRARRPPPRRGRPRRHPTSDAPTRWCPNSVNCRLLLLELRAQALVEEPAEQQHGADGQERERAGDRAQLREVVKEDLRQTEREDREASALDAAGAAGQTEGQRDQGEPAPEGADRGVSVLELEVDAPGTEPLE